MSWSALIAKVIEDPRSLLWLVPIGIFLAFLVPFLWRLYGRVKPQAERHADRAADGLARLPLVGGLFRRVEPVRVPVSDNIAAGTSPPSGPGTPGDDYMMDVFDGVRWRWCWLASGTAEATAEGLRPYCTTEGCDRQMDRTESGPPFARESRLACAACGRIWNRSGHWADIYAGVTKTIERNRRIAADAPPPKR